MSNLTRYNVIESFEPPSGTGFMRPSERVERDWKSFWWLSKIRIFKALDPKFWCTSCWRHPLSHQLCKVWIPTKGHYVSRDSSVAQNGSPNPKWEGLACPNGHNPMIPLEGPLTGCTLCFHYHHHGRSSKVIFPLYPRIHLMLKTHRVLGPLAYGMQEYSIKCRVYLKWTLPIAFTSQVFLFVEICGCF